MFKPPEEPGLVHELVAQSRHDAVVAVVRGYVVLIVLGAADGDTHVLQRVHPSRHFLFRLVRPFVEFLRHDLRKTEDRKEKRDCDAKCKRVL